MSGPGDPIDAIRCGFDAVAAQYAERFADELERKPFDRDLLQRFADRIRPDGRVLSLTEARRVLEPGGSFLATVHGARPRARSTSTSSWARRST